jgi:SpoVK/Ycf46/Vps4 family AAA+-type ATPase
MISQLLLEMDGVESTKDVVIIAATNRPDFIDTSFLRPGRFDSLIYIPPPDSEARKSILQMILKSMKVASSNEDGWLDRIVARTSRFTGADMRSLCMKAGLHSIKRDNQVRHC